MPFPPSWQPELTNDGSFTFFSEEFGEHLHSRAGAKQEALHKFVQATQLAHRAQQPTLRLLDVCYGLGYNTAAALETIAQVNPACQVELYGLELDASVPRAAIAFDLITIWSPPIQAILRDLAGDYHCQRTTLKATLLLGDARQTIQTLRQRGIQADVVFFDPFSPRRCPQLWTVEFFQQVAACLAPTGVLATYSRAASVRSALLAAGFCIGTIPPLAKAQSHQWSEGTVAAFQPDGLIPLSPMEQEHLQTRAAIPYRDPHLSDPAAVILERHRQEQARSSLASTSSWRRRWQIDA
ncbi:tRNA (5-methylaminomethyl-2-thiouridine)(34)-methyltransferase MnmD [Trichothermofontia sp.]